MKKSLPVVILSFILMISTSFVDDARWEKLFDKDLSKWNMYQSFRHKDNYKSKAPIDENGALIPPIGLNKNEAGFVTVSMVNKEPVLRISGETYGCVFTKKDYQNYHLKLMVKFGDKKWVPRLNEPKDSGLLYHSHGEFGDEYWHSWMPAEEFQIMEGGFGDYWCVGAVGAHIKMHDPAANKNMGVYDPKGIDAQMGVGGHRSGFVQHSQDYEKPGDWNSVELICYGDKSIQIINGHVVMALTQLVYKDGDTIKPLVKGKIQLQSEAAEVFYKDVQIKSINSIPAEYASYFE
jgi:hypothetical protein